MHVVKRLRVRGLWSLADIDLELEPLNVIVGANGAGKSSLLNTFRLLRALVSRGLGGFIADMGGAASVLYNGPKTTRHAELELEFEGPGGRNGYAATLMFVANDRFVFGEERVTFQRDPSGPVKEYTIGPGAHPESFLPLVLDAQEAATPTARAVKWHLDRFCHFHFHDTSRTAPLRQPSEVGDDAFLRQDGANLAAFLFALRSDEPRAYERVRTMATRIFPAFDDFVLEPSGRAPGMVSLRWREQGNAYDFGPHHLSDGTLRFIALATLLLQPGRPGDKDHPNHPLLIVLDEPELGLHPSALSLVSEMLRVAPAQRIVATQSVDMVSQLVSEAAELSRIVIAERGQRGSTFRHADPATLTPWFDEYSPGQMWTHGLLGALP